MGMDRSLPIHGRGSADNPPNRFERLEFAPDPTDRGEEPPAPGTVYLRDPARTLIVRNDSPDVGFDYGINPYRGCENGCSYCLDGDTRILMADGTTRALRALRVGDEIYGTRRVGWFRRFVRTTVLAHWRTRKPAYRVSLEDGTTLIASGDHRFLTERGWKHVAPGDRPRPSLTSNNKLMGTGRFAAGPGETPGYKAGYLTGMIRGDANLKTYTYHRGGRREEHFRFRLALADVEALDRSQGYLEDLGVATDRFGFAVASTSRRPMSAIRTQARGAFERIQSLIRFPAEPPRDWTKGFLAGIFDAEGSRSANNLRIFNTDPELLAQVAGALGRLGFDWVEESHRSVRSIRIRGGLAEHLRFIHTTDPAILRKRDIEGHAVKTSAALRVRSVDALGVTLPLFDITTGTGDFIAEGVVSHNCFARPTHEYLGYSAGLDFETRILVKEDAPQILRRELSARSWKGAPIGMSGITDPYQPVETRLRLTRRCLEVLAEFRNPVAVITKRHTVTRDLELYQELARHDAATVFLSVTTLDPELQRVMEPRAATPARRLDAISALAGAGVPVGVLIGPVIPGLNDHEIPKILEASARAGASFAMYVALRLPHGVKELFAGWLDRHFPERKEKVLGRVREIRGGKLYDSRFHVRGRGEGVYADQLEALFRVTRRRVGIPETPPALSSASFRVPAGAQLGLFD